MQLSAFGDDDWDSEVTTEAVQAIRERYGIDTLDDEWIEICAAPVSPRQSQEPDT